MNFEEFPKIARLHRDVVVTEKLDGTNAQVFVEQWSGRGCPPDEAGVIAKVYGAEGLVTYLRAGSRNRWITPEADNFGFARWVRDHAEELATLGEGRHFGEWWGAGIQRRYGLAEKRFSLFNVARWIRSEAERTPQPELHENRQRVLPACCDVVPVLYRGVFSEPAILACLERLRTEGSMAAPGFMDPEGVVVWHEAARVGFKKTLAKDDEPKGKTR